MSRTASLVVLRLQKPAHQVPMFTEYGRSVGISFVVRSQRNTVGRYDLVHACL